MKKKSTTYIVTINSTSTLIDIKTQLVNIMEQSGGLSSIDEVVDELDEEDIEIPKSDIIEEDNMDEIKSEGNELDINEIRLAIPNDVSDPYSNNWKEIKEDDDISEFNLKDYSIIAFAYGPEDEFVITEPAFEEN